LEVVSFPAGLSNGDDSEDKKPAATVNPVAGPPTPELSEDNNRDDTAPLLVSSPVARAAAPPATSAPSMTPTAFTTPAMTLLPALDKDKATVKKGQPRVDSIQTDDDDDDDDRAHAECERLKNVSVKLETCDCFLCAVRLTCFSAHLFFFPVLSARGAVW
jgi:hypothetical protein